MTRETKTPTVKGLLTILVMLTALAGAVTAAELKPGSVAPGFKLTDTEGVEHDLAAYLKDGKTVVLEWFNPDCPFIKKHHAKHRTMNETFAAVEDKNVVWLAINSGAPGKQGHGLERNRKAHEEYDMAFPILLDEDGAVGRAYGAKTTPHMIIVGSDGTVVYNGAIDDNASPQQLGATNHVAVALEAALAGKDVPLAQTRPYGCSVKYAN